MEILRVQRRLSNLSGLQVINKTNKKYNVLIYGSGAREHAIAWKINQSPLLNKIYLAKPNDGFKKFGEEVTFKSFQELAEKSINLNINIAVIGPEEPLAAGIVDILEQSGIDCIGVNEFWAQLESSKSFAKKFMKKHKISTARYEIIEDFSQADFTINKFNSPYVIKADGLCAGKGVAIVNKKQEALYLIKEYLDGKFGESSKKVVIEEFLEGYEISAFSLWDGKNLLSFEPCKDYKKLLDNDKGPNTGGMGAYCPVEINNIEKQWFYDYQNSLEKALKIEGANFKGIVYSGLIITKEGLKVLEYNVRFGDPEVQALMMLLETDLLEIFQNTLEQNLDKQVLKYKKTKSVCLVLASRGYPEEPSIGKVIDGLNLVKEKAQLFFAGVEQKDDNFITSGGRVLCICSCEDNSLENVYSAAKVINWENKYYRLDIGK